MRLTPKKIIYLAVSNYLSPEEAKMLLTEISRKDAIQADAFLKTIQKYFDFNLLKDKPFIPEDILIYNYVMYETKPKFNTDAVNRKQQIAIRARFPRSGCIVKYENKVMLPQLHLMEEAYKLLNKLD